MRNKEVEKVDEKKMITGSRKVESRQAPCRVRRKNPQPLAGVLVRYLDPEAQSQWHAKREGRGGVITLPSKECQGQLERPGKLAGSKGLLLPSVWSCLLGKGFQTEKPQEKVDSRARGLTQSPAVGADDCKVSAQPKKHTFHRGFMFPLKPKTSCAAAVPLFLIPLTFPEAPFLAPDLTFPDTKPEITFPGPVCLHPS